MRGLVAACLLACSAPKPPPPASVEPTKRTLIVRLEADGGEAILTVDGAERLRSRDRGNTIALDLREGEHEVAVRATPSQYGGMGLDLQVTAGEPVIALSCLLPCTGAKLEAWAQTIRAAQKPCPPVEVRSVDATVGASAIDLRFAMAIPPPRRCQ
jgi:hypothetical protein